MRRKSAALGCEQYDKSCEEISRRATSSGQTARDPDSHLQKAQGGGALQHGAATGVQVNPLPAVLAEVADVFPCQEPADHGQRREQLKIRMAAQDGCSKYYLGCDFFRLMSFTTDGVRLCTIFFSAKMTIRALFSPKNTILLCRYADTHTK
jgi:hypothetical protein